MDCDLENPGFCSGSAGHPGFTSLGGLNPDVPAPLLPPPASGCEINKDAHAHSTKAHLLFFSPSSLFLSILLKFQNPQV